MWTLTVIIVNGTIWLLTEESQTWVSPGATLCVAGFNELFCLLSCFLFVHGRCEKLHPGDKCGAQFKWFGHVTYGGPKRYMTFSCEISRYYRSRCIVLFLSRLSMQCWCWNNEDHQEYVWKFLNSILQWLYIFTTTGGSINLVTKEKCVQLFVTIWKYY